MAFYVDCKEPPVSADNEEEEEEEGEEGGLFAKILVDDNGMELAL